MGNPEVVAMENTLAGQASVTQIHFPRTGDNELDACSALLVLWHELRLRPEQMVRVCDFIKARAQFASDNEREQFRGIGDLRERYKDYKAPSFAPHTVSVDPNNPQTWIGSITK